MLTKQARPNELLRFTLSGAEEELVDQSEGGMVGRGGLTGTVLDLRFDKRCSKFRPMADSWSKVRDVVIDSNNNDKSNNNCNNKQTRGILSGLTIDFRPKDGDGSFLFVIWVRCKKKVCRTGSYLPCQQRMVAYASYKALFYFDLKRISGRKKKTKKTIFIPYTCSTEQHIA